MLKKLIMIGILLSSLNAKEGVQKVVFDLTTSDIKTFQKKALSGIANFKAHYQGKLEELEVSVVIHGNAYKFFVDNLASSPYAKDKELAKVYKDIKSRLAAMADIYEVEFLMCDIGRKKLKIDENNLYKFVDLVPNSTIGLIDKQNEGFAYVPIR